MGVQVLARPDSTLQIVELQNAIGSLWGAVKVGYLKHLIPKVQWEGGGTCSYLSLLPSIFRLPGGPGSS